METLAGLLCVAAILFVPLWFSVRSAGRREQLRVLQTDSDDLRIALGQVERALLERIETLEAELRLLQPTAAPVSAPVVEPPRPVRPAPAAAKTIAAPLVEPPAPPPLPPKPAARKTLAERIPPRKLETPPEAPTPPPMPTEPPVIAEPPAVEAPEPAVEATSEPEYVPSRRRLEHTLVWVIAAVGGGAVALSGLIFFAGALASGAIPPWVRVLGGMLLGAIALLGGEVLFKQQSSGPAAATSGAGAGLLYGALYASAIRYGLVPVELSFVLMCGLTGLCAWRADVHRSPLLAGMALAAGFATPLMLSTGENRPVLLLGYLALLNAGMLLSATRHQWKTLIFGSGVATLLMLTGWAVRFLTPGQLPVAVLGTGLLAAVFWTGAVWREEGDEADRLSGVVGTLMGGAAPVFLLMHSGEPLALGVTLAAWTAGAGAVSQRRGWPEAALMTGWLSVIALAVGAALQPGASLVLSAMTLAAAGLLAAGSREHLAHLALPGLIAGLIGAGVTAAGSLSATPLLLIELTALAGLTAWVSHRRGWPWLLDLTGAALVVFTAVSGSPLLTGGVLALMAGLGARRFHRAGLWAPVLGAAALTLPVIAGTVEGWPALLGLLTLSGAGALLAHIQDDARIAMLTAGLVCCLQLLFAAIGLPAHGAGPLLLVPPLIAAAGTRQQPIILGSLLSTFAAGTVLLAGAPEPVLLTPAVLGVGLALLAPAALPLAVVYGTAALLALPELAPVIRLLAAWALAGAALSMPQLRNDKLTHHTAMLAGAVLLLPMHLAWQALTGGVLSGLQPALVAGVTLAAAIRARGQKQETALGELLALGFATAAIVLQLSGPWQVLGLAGEMVALTALQRQLPMTMIRAGAVLLAGAVCCMLLNPIALQWSHNPLIWILPGAALLWSGEQLRGWDLRLARGVQLGGALLLFAALDLTIIGLFGGHGLRIDSLAGEMVRSLAWAGFGLAGMGVGVILRRSPVRMLALAFLCLSAGKVFLADLWQLHGLVRVGSVMGLGVFLLVAAVLLQRVVLAEETDA